MQGKAENWTKSRMTKHILHTGFHYGMPSFLKSDLSSPIGKFLMKLYYCDKILDNDIPGSLQVKWN